MAKPKSPVARRLRNNEPDYIASAFIADEHTIADKATLHYYRRNFWRYTGTRYERIDEDSLRASFHDHFAREVAKTETKVRNGGLEGAAWNALKARATLASAREMPSWLNAACMTGEADHNIVAFQNGLLPLANAMQGIVSLRDHTHEWFSETCLPFNYDPTAECGEWLKFLSDIFDGDVERVALLQEWFGYCLTPDTSRHKFMLFEGVARAGKGVTAGVLSALLGLNNVSSIRLEMFADRFQLRQTVGKLLNVVDETDKVERFQEGVFKTYVAGGMHYFDIKGKEGFEAKPTARVLIIANERPPISDKSEGMWARMLLLPFRKSYKDKEDFGLAAKLEAELPGIFNWAVAGLARLRAQGAFTLPAVSEAEIAQYKRDSNPARAWLLATYEPRDSEAEWITRKSLYELYQGLCKDEGITYRLTMTSFNREVRAAFPQAQEQETRDCGTKVWKWIGIRERD